MSSLLGVSSIGTANVLVLLRVVTLWDRDRVSVLTFLRLFLNLRVALVSSESFYVRQTSATSGICLDLH